MNQILKWVESSNRQFLFAYIDCSAIDPNLWIHTESENVLASTRCRHLYMTIEILYLHTTSCFWGALAFHQENKHMTHSFLAWLITADFSSILLHKPNQQKTPHFPMKSIGMITVHANWLASRAWLIAEWRFFGDSWSLLTYVHNELSVVSPSDPI